MILNLRKRIGSIPLIAMAVLGLGLFSPSKSEAGCGDYISYANGGMGIHPDLAMNEHESKTPKCSGPNCTEAPPPAPMPQTPSQIRILIDKNFLELIAITNGSDSFNKWICQPANGEAIAAHFDVFHPPR